MDRHAAAHSAATPAPESEGSGGIGESTVCDLPIRLPVTKDEIDTVLFHARDLIEALMDVGSAPSN